MLWSYTVDWFTLYHFMLWAGIGVALQLLFRPSLFEVVAFGFVLGIGWEVFELAVIEPWLLFHEPVLNRWLTDPIADVSGIAAGAYSVIRYMRRWAK